MLVHFMWYVEKIYMPGVERKNLTDDCILRIIKATQIVKGDIHECLTRRGAVYK